MYVCIVSVGYGAPAGRSVALPERGLVSEPGAGERSATASVAAEINGYIDAVRGNGAHDLRPDPQVIYASGSPACAAVGGCLERHLGARPRPSVVAEEVKSRADLRRLSEPLEGCRAVTIVVVERDDVPALCRRLGFEVAARQGWVLVAALSRLSSPSELVAVPSFLKDGGAPPWQN